jgi:hypothetical protein
MSWASICFTVSKPTPIMIRTAVPPERQVLGGTAVPDLDEQVGQHGDHAEVNQAGKVSV